MSNQKRQEEPAARSKISFLQLIQSTLWAALGVQREENHNRDFTHGHWLHFVIMGIAFTVFFAGSLITVVHLVVSAQA